MKEPTKYEQLQAEDRMSISSMSQQRCSVRTMARTLHRAPSTICRELLRNTTSGKAYGPHVAQQACQALRRAVKPETRLDVDGLCLAACSRSS